MHLAIKMNFAQNTPQSARKLRCLLWERGKNRILREELDVTSWMWF